MAAIVYEMRKSGRGVQHLGFKASSREVDRCRGLLLFLSRLGVIVKTADWKRAQRDASDRQGSGNCSK